MPATTSTCRDVAGREASVTAVIGLNPRIPCHKLSTILSSLIPQSTSLMVIIMNRNSPFDEIEQFLGRAPSAATARGGVTSGPPTSMWPSTTTSSWSWPTSRDTTAKTSTCGRRRAAYDYRRARCGERGRGPTVSPARAAPRVGHSVRRPSGTRRRRGRERDVPPRRPHDHAPEGCRRDGRRPPDRRGVRALFGFARSLFFAPCRQLLHTPHDMITHGRRRPRRGPPRACRRTPPPERYRRANARGDRVGPATRVRPGAPPVACLRGSAAPDRPRSDGQRATWSRS